MLGVHENTNKLQALIIAWYTAQPESNHDTISMQKCAMLAGKPICRQTCPTLHGRFHRYLTLCRFLSCALRLNQLYHNLSAFCELCSRTCKRVILNADHPTLCLSTWWKSRRLDLLAGSNCLCSFFILFHIFTWWHLYTLTGLNCCFVSKFNYKYILYISPNTWCLSCWHHWSVALFVYLHCGYILHIALNVYCSLCFMPLPLH